MRIIAPPEQFQGLKMASKRASQHSGTWQAPNKYTTRLLKAESSHQSDNVQPKLRKEMLNYKVGSQKATTCTIALHIIRVIQRALKSPTPGHMPDRNQNLRWEPGDPNVQPRVSSPASQPSLSRSALRIHISWLERWVPSSRGRPGSH